MVENVWKTSSSLSHEDVKALRIAQGMKPDPNGLLRQWVKRGVVVKDEAAGVYAKL